MQLYDTKIDEALSYLTRPDIFLPTGDRPICYVTYDVNDAMELYHSIDTLKNKADYYNFKVEVVSFGKLLQDFFAAHQYRRFWEDQKIKEADLFQSMREEIIHKDVLVKSLKDLYISLQNQPNTLLVLKDLELLHPFDKIGRVEQQIYNFITVPTLVLYPGTAQGTARSFLNIYQMDGSYRSKNF